MTIIIQNWQSQILFYMHQQPMVPDHGTQYEENQSSHHGGICEDWQTGPFPIFPDSALAESGNNIKNLNYETHRRYIKGSRYVKEP